MSELSERLVRIGNRAIGEHHKGHLGEAETVVAAVLRELAAELAKAEHDFTGWPDSADLAILADEIEAAG